MSTVLVVEDEPQIAEIFDRFYKGRASRGSGLGLTIARNLIAAHGGTIHAESTPGRGTTIRFTLSYVPHDPEPAGRSPIDIR